MGIPLAERVQGRRDVDRRDGWNHADGESSADFADSRGDLGGGTFRRVKTLPGCGEEGFPGGSQSHPAACAVEEPGAEFPLQAGDLVAERGLNDQTPLRGSGEAARFRDGEDVPHLLEFHRLIVNGDGSDDNHVLD